MMPYLAPDAAIPMTSCAPRLAEIKARPAIHAGIDRPERKKRSEEHTSELQSQSNLVCRLLLEQKNREEAGDKRSAPQDVTSSWVRRGGVNLQQEVAPQQTERPPRDSPVEDTPD